MSPSQRVVRAAIDARDQMAAELSGLCDARLKSICMLPPEQQRQALGKNLRALRKRAGLTIGRLSSKCVAAGTPVSKTHIGAIEAGRREPSIHKLCVLARALKVDLIELLIIPPVMIEPATASPRRDSAT